MIYGYASAAGDGGSIDAQTRQLRSAGAEKIFKEGATGGQADRGQLRRVLSRLGEGDVLMVTRLDRLANSTRELVRALAAICETGAAFRSLDDAWADTTTSAGKRRIAVFRGLAEFERKLQRTRTDDGHARAVAHGVKLGRRPKLTPRQQDEAIRRREAGESVREIARAYNVSHTTISRLIG